MINKTYDFNLGEAKYIVSHIQPKNPKETVVINEALYTLTCDGETLEEGSLTIDGLNLSYLFRAESKGFFVLTEKVTIGAETFIEQAAVRVR